MGFWIIDKTCGKIVAYSTASVNCILVPLLVEVPPGNISCSNHPSTRSRAHHQGLEEGKN